MKRMILIAFFLIPVLAIVGWAVVSRSAPDGGKGDLALLAKYREWTLVNPEPQLMEPLPAMSCAIIPGRGEPSPHLHKYVSVFVNSVGREQMMTKRTPKYPVGSMIVKEKWDSKDSARPEMLTGMIKRQKGYYPEGGDWEYFVLDGPASKIVEQGKLERCSVCHRPYQNYDFITRTYLPEPVRFELKP